MTIFIGGLHPVITEVELRDVLVEYGTIKQIKIPKDRETGEPRGFAFADMSSEAEEAVVIEELDGAEWAGKILKVKKAEPRTAPPGKSLSLKKNLDR